MAPPLVCTSVAPSTARLGAATITQCPCVQMAAHPEPTTSTRPSESATCAPTHDPAGAVGACEASLLAMGPHCDDGGVTLGGRARGGGAGLPRQHAVNRRSPTVHFIAA